MAASRTISSVSSLSLGLRHKASVAVAIAGIFTLVVACGGRSDTESDTPSGPTATATARQPFILDASLQPTSTPFLPTTPTPTRAEFQEQILDVFRGKNVSWTGYGVKAVNLARFTPGRLELEYQTLYAAQASQPAVSYEVMKVAAGLVETWSDFVASAVSGGDGFTLVLTTYSTDGKYRYHSETNLATLKKVATKAITYEEWVAASGAGFK